MSILSPQASGVYISEVNFSQTLTQASNAVAAQIMVAGQGPVGPTFFTDPGVYLATYGNPNAAVSFDQYCGLDYFKDGNGLWANRVVEASARYGALAILALSSGATAIRAYSPGVAQSEFTLPNWSSYVSAGESAMYLVTPQNGPGSFASNIAVSLVSDNLPAPTGLALASASTGGSMVAGTYGYVVSAVNAYGAESLASSVVTSTLASGTTNAITLSWSAVSGAVAYNIYGRTSTASTMGLITTVGTAKTTFLDDGLTAASGTVHPITVSTNLTLSDKFTLKVFDLSLSTSTPVEQFYCSMNDGVDGSGAPTEVTQRVNPFSAYIQVTSNISALVTQPTLSSVNTAVALAGGTSGSAPTSATINAGWAVFNNKSKYTIDTMMNAGRATPVIQQAMDAVAQTRSDCIAFDDLPSASQGSSNAIDYRNVTLNLNSSYSALFGPDLLESDPISGKFLFVPPSGAMCGLFARTSNLKQPWWSMAGLNRGLVRCLDVRYTYDDGEMTRLFASQVNYMRKFQGAGIALWEQTTLSSQSSALQFINVRALCNTIKRATYSYLLYGLQDPLDDILKLSLVTGLNEYLALVAAGRGISKGDVIASKVNNPDILANSGILAIAIIIVPILATQKIKLTLGISKQGLQISEATIASL